MQRALKLSLFLFAIVLVNSSPAADVPGDWWRDTFIYQIYPRSFKDSNGDGIGDLNGITDKLEHLADIGVSTVWLSPIFVSPMVDFGYDIANFTDIDPIFGNLKDFERLTAKAKSLRLKVVLDFVPNHSSDKHPWFRKSIQRIKPYDEYYVWSDGKLVNGTRQPPNNWMSGFQGSAWEWNVERGQYYLHQFAIGQPDLNYRSAALMKEMADVLTFWIDRGVDGFRIDAVALLFEDAQLRDEPVIPNTGLPPTDSGNLEHIYTRDLPEVYGVLKSWRQSVDNLGGGKKILLTEAYTTIPLTMKYYEAGGLPMNFMFISNLTGSSKNTDFKKSIDLWLNNMPHGDYVANWVVGNHDNHRAASRFGVNRADQLSMLAAVLPGVGIIYNGDEIGMEDTPVTWNQTVDPAGCNAGPDKYSQYSRDPERTPYQWDDTISAGFSTSNRTWLPINPNYKSLNLRRQKMTGTSHYAVFKKLVALKKLSVIKNGTTQIILMENNTFGVVRRLPDVSPVILLINFSDVSVGVDASTWLNAPEEMTVYVTSVGVTIPIGTRLNITVLRIPPAGSLILV
ncbi:maltase 1-like [Fopius arisanus]|uniref:alpha-glucosidase n=1 Tax=Fopius arisanus TaxID=64838 RepID=A0A9R1T368_9HYME|nr:PREDICTED: maltase 1-like [Fopius arisanus]